MTEEELLDETHLEFFEVVAFVKPYHPLTSTPFMTVYARNRTERDRLVERFEQDGLEVRVNPKTFLQLGDMP